MITTLIKNEIKKYFPEIIKLRRHLHKYPEVSFQEIKTSQFIEQYLKNIGITDIRTHVGLNGIVARIKVPNSKNTIAFRADFDALPINDAKNTEYKSTIPNVMHACGHDGHTTALLITCKILMKNIDKLTSDVVAIFQYGEEQAPGGAKPMIDDGCLVDVDAIFGAHLWTPLPLGTLGFNYKELCAAADRFEVKITSKKYANIIGAEFVSLTQQIVSRFSKPRETLVITLGKFESTKSCASITGTIRHFNKKLHKTVLNKLNRLCKSLESEYLDTTIKFIYYGGYPPLINHKKGTEEILVKTKDILPELNLQKVEPLMIGEDFAYYLENVPGAFFLIGAGNNTFAQYPHHHPNFDFEERVMQYTASIFLNLAFNADEIIQNLKENSNE
ncbi:amidohydrolase [Gemella bergeri ATCC 700627]|uniref:Amidohydrolase n=1 Tax=Gemella bergeri ATCC 700627 TaxID=1321820 RepID=U2Q4I8_9BACL|nr:amidohydrolase [Gemella bergeri]ERK57690.1 amidohydrolase [Gemella bergeri ATCC 700627]